jgi:type IV secretory pathway TraG/TraD family ATPase VirD4
MNLTNSPNYNQNQGGGGMDSAAVGIAGGVILAGLVLGFVLSLLFWFSGQLSGLVWGGNWPNAAPNESIRIFIGLFSHPGDPAAAWPADAREDVGPAAVVYLLFLILCAPIAWGATLAGQYAARFRRRREIRVFRLGFADGGEIRKLLSAHAVIKKAKSVRPSYKGKRNINPQDVGFYLGRDTRSRRKLYCSVEDVMLVVAPPRQGKDVHFCIPNIIDAPGPCVATTTRSDMFAATVTMREKMGQVWVFDPNDMTNWPTQLRWSPVNGCEEPLIALNRAAAFVAGAGVGEGVQNASYWTGVATAILRCYLLAAATSGRTITDVVRWSTQPTNPEPIQILRKMEGLGRAPQGWAGELESGASADGETRGNMWSGVRRALDCFADPRVLASCSPGPGETFDVATFVRGRNTLYVLGKEKKNGSVAPLVTAMMEDIFDQVRKIASRMPNSRIDPPLTVELNEVAHIAPMPNLPGYMGDSGGFSIALHVYLQSLGQARGKWGNDEAAVMWDTAAIRVVMGGSGYVNDLEDISRLLGEVDEKTKSISRGAGGKSTSYSKQKRRVLTIDELRTLEFGTALVIARAARPVEAKLTPYFKRKDAKEIGVGQARVSKIIADVDDSQSAVDLLAPTGLLAAAAGAGGGGSGGFAGGGGTNGGAGGGIYGGGIYGGGTESFGGAPGVAYGGVPNEPPQGWQSPMFSPAAQPEPGPGWYAGQQPYQAQPPAAQPVAPYSVSSPPPAAGQVPQLEQHPHSSTLPQLYQPREDVVLPAGVSPNSTGSRQNSVAEEQPAGAPRMAAGWGPVRRTDQE